MKVRIFVRGILFTILSISALAVIGTGQTPAAKAPVVFTEKDREFALKYMNETKADYLNQLTGISDAQLNFRAGEGRWTIAEIAEHITVVEEALFGLVTNGTLKAVQPKCEEPFRVIDTMVILAAINRSQKFSAPEQVRPNGRWKTVPELAASFEKTRSTSIDFMKNNKVDLRNRFGAGPMGTLDAFQQLLFMTAHSERHLAQLKEVKADPKYPKK